MFARGSSVHQKCSNYALTDLLFGLYKFVWIIDPLVIHPSPHLRAPTCPSTPGTLGAKEHAPTPYPSIVCTHIWVYQGIWECVNFLRGFHGLNRGQQKCNLLKLKCKINNKLVCYLFKSKATNLFVTSQVAKWLGIKIILVAHPIMV